MRERESLEEEATMGPPLSGFTFIDPPEYQHPEDDDYNPHWEENEWVDAAYYYEGDEDEIS